MQKRWVIKEGGNPDVVERLAHDLNIDGLLANLLVQRGITTFDEAKDFFRPDIEKLHDPFLMKDMDVAIERIEKAIQNNEKILIYGDYDVDGTTAVSLVYSFLKTLHDNIDYYIPDRYAEGYGVSFKGIDFAKENGFSLIICLDCGIKAIDKIKYAKENNIDFIVCDHHLPACPDGAGDELPEAVAVLDPKRSDCNYPFDELCGCGIGFKLVQAYSQKNNIPFESLEEYLDLAAISIASDIVPIVGENRILAYFGLKRLNTNPRQGIKSMLELNNIKRELTVTNIVFIIGPRINAAGRIESGRKAVELLISNNAKSAEASSKSINLNNIERRNIDSDITQQAFEMIEKDSRLIHRKTTVLFDPGWHKGVIGIVASRLIERYYYRPTIILTESNGMATGSVRSVKNFNVYNAVEACSDLLEQFGGHKYAAGLTLKLDNVPAFQEKFEQVVSDTIDERLLTPEIEIDAEIELGDINPKLYRILKQFEPFGPMNMTPVFKTQSVVDKGYARIVGDNHLKLHIIHHDSQQTGFSAIAFNQGEHLEDISKGNPFDICYNIEENEWNGKTMLQLNIKDIKWKLE